MKRINVSSEFLKWIALLAMTVDHVDFICAKMGWLHNTLGRIAFPIFSFLLLSNFITYHPVKKYLIRMGSFALVSQALFYLFHFESTNVLFSFFYALLFISSVEELSKIKSFCIQLYFVFFLLINLFPFVLIADYSLFGFFFLLALYAYLRKKTVLNCTAVFLTGFFINSYNILSALITLMILVFLLFGIQVVKGRRLIKWWFFYLYYPLHKLGLHLLSNFF